MQGYWEHGKLCRLRRQARLRKQSCVPVRDEFGKFAGVRPRTAADQALTSAGGVFKSAAAAVLALEMRLLSTGGRQLHNIEPTAEPSIYV